MVSRLKLFFLVHKIIKLQFVKSLKMYFMFNLYYVKNCKTNKEHFEKKWLFINEGLSFDQELIYDFTLMCVVADFAYVINNLSIYYTSPHTACLTP